MGKCAARRARGHCRRRPYECLHQMAMHKTSDTLVDPYFYPLYQRAQDMDLAICIHAERGNLAYARYVEGERASQNRLPVMSACHSLLYECCPDRLRGVLDAGATRLGLHATGGAPGDVAAMIDHTLLRPDAARHDIEALCREAAIVALREDRKARVVNKNHFEEALRTVRSSVTEEVIKYYDRLAEQLGQTAVKKVATGNAGGMEFL